MTAATPTPSGQKAPGPEPPPVPGLEAIEHDDLTVPVPVVVHSPPSHVVVAVPVAVKLIWVVSIVLSAETHVLTSLAAT